MATPSSSRFSNIGNIGETPSLPSSKQQESPKAPPTQGLSVQPSTSQPRHFAHSGTDGNVHLSAPVQLVAVNGNASPWEGNRFTKLEAIAYYNAAGKGDLATVKSMLDAGLPVDATKACDIYAIAKAAQQGHLNVVTYLIEKGACAASRPYAIAAALAELPYCENPAGQKEVVKHLIRSLSAGDARETAIATAGVAIAQDDRDLLNSLRTEVEAEEIAHSGTGENVHLSAPVQLVAVNGNALPSQGDSFKKPAVSAYFNAAIMGDLNTVKSILDAGLPVDATDAPGFHAIAAAAEQGHLNVVTCLIEKGACAASRIYAIAAAVLGLLFGENPAGRDEVVKHLIRSFPAGEARQTAIATAGVDIGTDGRDLLNSLCTEVEVKEITDC